MSEKDNLQGEDGRTRTGDHTWNTASRSLRSEEGKSWETVALDG
jgi:hypothetical protein